jgi:hypothetical protein
VVACVCSCVSWRYCRVHVCINCAWWCVCVDSTDTLYEHCWRLPMARHPTDESSAGPVAVSVSGALPAVTVIATLHQTLLLQLRMAMVVLVVLLPSLLPVLVETVPGVGVLVRLVVLLVWPLALC